MKNVIRLPMLLAAAVALLCAATNVTAQTKQELQERFRQRAKQVQQLKTDRLVGETWMGYLEPVKDQALEKDAAALMREENADRRTLYEILAREERTSVEEVEVSAGDRFIKRAGNGEWVKLRPDKGERDDKWVQVRREK